MKLKTLISHLFNKLEFPNNLVKNSSFLGTLPDTCMHRTPFPKLPCAFNFKFISRSPHILYSSEYSNGILIYYQKLR